MAEIKSFPKARVNSFISREGKVTSYPQSGRLPRTPSVGTPANTTIVSGKYAYEGKPSTKTKIQPTSEARISKIRESLKPKLVSSNQFAYGAPKTPPPSTSIAGAIKGVAGAIGRGALRAAGPVGALAGMTTPAGLGSDKPSGPLMRGNAPKARGPGASMAAAKANASARSAVQGKMGPSSTQTGGVKSAPRSGMMGPSRSGSNSGGAAFGNKTGVGGGGGGGGGATGSRGSSAGKGSVASSKGPGASQAAAKSSAAKSSAAKSSSGKMGASSSQKGATKSSSPAGSKSYGGPR